MNEQQRVVLVTGASRGIGYFAALEAAKQGAHIIALARTVGGLEDLDDAIGTAGGSATLVPVDLTDFEALDRVGAALHDRYGRLDGLIANAGILGSITPMGHIEPKEFDKVMAVNVTANYRLIRSLDPLLKVSHAGRAVFVSSGAVKTNRAYWGLYAATKAALESMALSYAHELVQTRICANLFRPGRVRTAMRAKAAPGEDLKTLTDPRDAGAALASLISPEMRENGAIFDFSTRTLRQLNDQKI